jgi:hypothetical protein
MSIKFLYDVQEETITFILQMLKGIEDVQLYLHIPKSDLHNPGSTVYVCLSYS